jgi:glycosyltransferase involved in cell wall biosynthesis
VSTDRARLSLCVPTYNRCVLLRDALAALDAEWQRLSPARRDRLEFVICDNASTDDTPLVANQFVSRHGAHAQYRRRTTNIGGDNVYLCTETATGDFVLILSDDDVLLPWALTRLFDLLDQDTQLDAVALNSRSFKISPDEISRTPFEACSDVQLRSRDELFTELGTMLTFLSILVYRRTLVAETDYTFARDTNLIQSYAYADVLNRGSRFATLAEPVLAYRLGNVGGYDYARVFVDGYLDLLAYAHRGGMSTTAYERMKRHHLRTHVLQMMVNFKRYGAAGGLRPDWRGTRQRVWRRYRDYPVGAAMVTAATILPAPVTICLEDVGRAAIRAARWTSRQRPCSRSV